MTLSTTARNPRRAGSRCGKRPCPVTQPRREDGKEALPRKLVLTTDGELYRTVGKTRIDLAQIGPESARFGTAITSHERQQGETVAPRSALTVFLPERSGPRENFKRRWEKAGVRFRALHKGTTAKLDDSGQIIHVPRPVVDKRGRAYSVDGPPEVLRAMLCDPRCQGSEQATLARHALNSGQFARKPKAPAGTIRRQTAYRTVNGAPVFVRI